MKDGVLRQETFREISAFIYEKCGIFIPPTKKYLIERRLARVIQEHNLGGFDDYLYLVKYSSNGTELSRLYDAITTNETYFFREPQHFDVLVEHIVPEISRGRKGPMKIWSAACATGEEPYTVAMVLKEKLPYARTEITGSDISPGALDSAGRAVYNSYSLRNIPKPYLRRHFRPIGQDYELDQSIKGLVSFKTSNLVDKRMVSEMGDLDVIFCRNVFIYFDAHSKQKAVSYLYDSLRTGGYLFIGVSESLHNVTRAFKPVTFNGVVVYQKV